MGTDRESKTPVRFDDGVAEELVVGLRAKDCLAVVSALDNLLGLTGDDVAGDAGHEKSRKEENSQLSMN